MSMLACVMHSREKSRTAGEQFSEEALNFSASSIFNDDCILRKVLRQEKKGLGSLQTIIWRIEGK